MLIQAWWNITSANWRHHQFGTRIKKDGGLVRFRDEEVLPTIEWIEASGHTPILQFHNPFGSRIPMQADAVIELKEDDFERFVPEGMYERLTSDFVEVWRPIANQYELTYYGGSPNTDEDFANLIMADHLDDYVDRFAESFKMPLDANMSIAFDASSLVNIYDSAYGEMIWIRNLMMHSWFQDFRSGNWHPHQLVYVEAMPTKSHRHFWNWPMQAWIIHFEKQCVHRLPNKIFPTFYTNQEPDPDFFTTPRFCLQVRPHWRDVDKSVEQIRRVVGYHKINKAFTPQFYCKEHMDRGWSLNRVLDLEQKN